MWNIRNGILNFKEQPTIPFTTMASKGRIWIQTKCTLPISRPRETHPTLCQGLHLHKCPINHAFNELTNEMGLCIQVVIQQVIPLITGWRIIHMEWCSTTIRSMATSLKSSCAIISEQCSTHSRMSSLRNWSSKLRSISSWSTSSFSSRRPSQLQAC